MIVLHRTVARSCRASDTALWCVLSVSYVYYRRLNRSEDHLLTLDEEIQYVWKAPWTLPKGMFLANRYGVPLLTIINTWRESFCGVT